MPLVKHPEHGNKHVTDAEVAKLVAEGWAVWPRASEVKGQRGNKHPKPVPRPVQKK